MRSLSTILTFIIGALFGGVVVGVVTNPKLAILSKAEAVFAQIFEGKNTGISAPEQIRKLTQKMDFDAVEEILSQAHKASLIGEITYDELREMFRVFQSTAPKMQEFVEAWVDEARDSPYALSALTWNLYTAGWHMRGELSPQFSYMEGRLRFINLHERATRLARRAYEIAPNLVPASDAMLRLTLTNGSNSTTPPSGAAQQVRILEKVMALTPNRGSLVRALSITQPNWGGSFEGAVLICSKFADLVPDVDGYSTDICLVDAAYTYKHGAVVKYRAREALNGSDAEYLDYARRQDWEPGISRRQDQEILEYLEGEGSTDYKLARNYDRSVSDLQGSLSLTKVVYAAFIAETSEQLSTDPYNPKLIKFLTEPPFGALPGDYEDSHDEDFKLAKLALNAAPYDADVWNNIALVSHSSTHPTNAEEIPYFENAMIFANYKPAYFFEYLTAKRADHAAIYEGANNTNLTGQQLASVDEAVTCPLIRLVRSKEMMCLAVQNDDPYYYTTACEWDPVNDGFLDGLISQAESRNACDFEISSETMDLFVMEPSETDFTLPVPLRP
ncbi:MAG: hypothetical protein V3V25_02775 [Paracoccaceae bacterium]